MAFLSTPTMVALACAPALYISAMAAQMRDLPFDKATRLFVGRSVFAPVVAMRWLRAAKALHRRHEASPPSARTLLKPLRRYFDASWRPSRRLQALLDHHAWMEARFSDAFLRRFYSGQAQIAARLDARKGAQFHLLLANSASVSTQREGEIALSLVNPADGVRLARLTLLHVEVGGAPALAIGGLQGAFGGYKREVIDSTRLLHGLRPKDAALLAARALARALDLELIAICDARHVLERLQGGAKQAVYDAYWLERGASPDPRFGFSFAALEAPTEGGGPREALKAGLVAQIEAFVAQAGRAGTVANLSGSL